MTKKSRDRRVLSRSTTRTKKALDSLSLTLKGVEYNGPDINELAESLKSKHT